MRKFLVLASVLATPCLANADVRVYLRDQFACSATEATSQQATVTEAGGKVRVDFHQSIDCCIIAGANDVIEWIRADPGVQVKLWTPPTQPIFILEEIGSTSTVTSGIQVVDVRIVSPGPSHY